MGMNGGHLDGNLTQPAAPNRNHLIDYQHGSAVDHQQIQITAQKQTAGNNVSMHQQYWNAPGLLHSNNIAAYNHHAAPMIMMTSPFIRILSPDHLSQHQQQHPDDDSAAALMHTPLEEDSLVRPEDIPLITDYFRFLMSQFQPCKFQESDRTARGGKRETIELGFGGLQCRHCNANHPIKLSSNCHDSSSKTTTTTTPGIRGRKFFWSHVDRLANSISEFSSHLNKCRACPTEVKMMSMKLKEVHPVQAAKVSRGSQKAFLRRVWARIHADDGDGCDRPLCSQEKSATCGDGCENEADGAMMAAISSSDRLLLSSAIIESNKEQEDKVKGAQVVDNTSALDRLLLQNIEVFEADCEDVKASETTSSPVLLGQVGLRCVYCAVALSSRSQQNNERHSNSNVGASSTTKKRKQFITTQNTVYPLAASDVFDAVEDLRCHFECCPSIPANLFGKLIRASKSFLSCPSIVARQSVYEETVKKIKIMDCVEGIRYDSGDYC